MFEINKNLITPRKEPDDPFYDGDIGVAGGGSQSSGGSSSNKEEEQKPSNDSFGDDSTLLPGTNTGANLTVGKVNLGRYVTTQNPRLSYFGAQPSSVAPSDGRDLVTKMSRLEFAGNEIPPSFHDDYYALRGATIANIGRSITSRTSDNTRDIDDTGYFRLGTFVAVIPPEYIQVSTSTGANQISTLRGASPTYIKSNYATRTVTVKLFLNGFEGVNGMEVDSPFGYSHYINGFRHLIGMFKLTPFVPVENTYLNFGHDILNVALIGITASTVEGFPNTLEVTLMLEEANLGPYIGLDALYDDFLIKPLFNFYVQRYIRDSTVGSFPMTRGRFVENLKISMINPRVLEVDDDSSQIEGIYYNSDGTIDLLDSRNYIETINIDNEKANIVNMQISYNNEMPKVHMAGYETPVFQFIHGGVSSFSIEIETQDEAFISSIDDTIRNSLEAGRDHAHKIGMGFLKVENEILGLNGISLALVTEFSSETVPGFPGLFIVTLSGTGYDAGQRDREKFKSFRPFYDESDVKGEGWYEGRRGTREDLITQSDKGMANKVLQDACAEAKIMTTEMYPDLRLPKYSAVDWALGEIIKFYKSHNLSTDGIPTKLARTKALIPGRGPNKVEYTGFADPDFYMSYPLTPADIDSGVSGGSSRSLDEEESQEARNKFNEEMIKQRDYIHNETKGMSPSDREKTIRSGISSGDVSKFGLIPMLLPLPIVPNVIKEPEYVPGFNPDEQIRIHHTHMMGNTFDEDGNLKDGTDMLIEKLNAWVRYSGGGSSYAFENYEGSFAGDAMLDQPGNNIDIPTQVKKVTGIPFVDLALNRASVKCGYVYGSDTEVMTANRVYYYRSQYPKYVNLNNSLKWVGRMCWDCSSFVAWALRYMGYNMPRTSSYNFHKGEYPGIYEDVAWEDMQLGDILYGGGHVAIYLGNGEVVHARGAAYGCMVNVHNYTKGGKSGFVSRVKNLAAMSQAFLAANPTFYADDRVQGPVQGDGVGDGDEEGMDDVWQPGDDPSLLPGVGFLSETINERGALTKNTQREVSTITATGSSINRSSSQVSLGQFPDSIVSTGVSRDNLSAANKWDSLVMSNAAKYNLDPNIVKAVMAIESSGNPSASNSCCHGLMQVNVNVWGVTVAQMHDPDTNLEKGSFILDDYGSDPVINYDKDNWMRSYNAGITRGKSIIAGNGSWPSESINYAKKFDVYYALLLASGGHYGDRNAPTINGQKVSNEWVAANLNGNEVGSGAVLDGSVSSGGLAGGGIDSTEVKVWFEREEEKTPIVNKDLKNLFAGLIRSVGVVNFNISLVGLHAVASAISSLLTGRSNEEIEHERQVYDRKVQALYNKYQNNLDHERRLSKEVIDVTPPPYVVGTTVIVPPTVTVGQSSTSTSTDSPSMSDFSIGFVDNLSNKELKIDHAKIARQDSMQNDGRVTEKMLVDSTEKALKFRLSKAFPSYLFMIVDEHDNWIDEKKFWSNYYIYQSLLSIDVSSSYNNPVTTARISMSNIYRNVKKFKAVKSDSELILGADGKVNLFGRGDSEYSWFNQMAYKFTGSLFTEQITDEIVDIRNTLHDEVFIREGIRLHIRLGYGSNPANYSPVFNGNIYEVQEDGEIITVAAQSDGVELISNVLTDRTTATNKDLGLPEEGGDIIAGILCNRESEFMYGISDGAWAIGNTYGINHFGLYTANKGGWKAFRWEPTSYENDDYTSTLGGLTGGVGHLEVPNPAPVTGIQFNKWWRRDTYEYDLIKNVYKCTYEGKYAFDPQVLWFDGETNMRFMCNDKTPWDVFKLAEKAMCEFVAYPRIYGFEHRIFYGLPWWLCKFRYERDDRNQDVFEIAKSFSQLHIMTTETDIIDNKMVASSRGLVINLVGIYTLGSNLASTTVIMSDFNIDRSRQSTATIDTTAIQDNFKYLGSWINNSIEWIGALDNARYNAIQICVSELLDNWLNTYKGVVLTLGAPEINAHDFVYLSDNYALIHGLVKVKDVVHSFNSNTGFTTSIHPGMVGGSRLHTSGFGNVSRSLLQVGVSTTAFITAFGVLNKTLTMTSKAITAAKLAWSVGGKAIPFLKSAGSGIVAYVKGAGTKIAASEMVTGLMAYVKGTALGGKIGALVTSIGAKITGSGIIGAIKGGVVGVLGILGSKILLIAVAIGALVAAVFGAKTFRDVKESFEMRNSIFVVPVTRYGYSFIAGANGQQKLIDMEYFQDMNGEGER